MAAITIIITLSSFLRSILFRVVAKSSFLTLWTSSMMMIIIVVSVIDGFTLTTTRNNYYNPSLARRKIISRFSKHGVMDELSLSSTYSNVRPRRRSIYSSTTELSFYTQVVSDIDDTIKSSGGVAVGGVALGGIDVQYKRGTIYPGVAEFMLQISLGPSFSFPSAAASSIALIKKTSPTPPKVAVLTARAEELKMALEIKESNKISIAYTKAGMEAGIQGWGIGPVLYGSVAEWIVQYRKGLRKFSNFERLLEQDPTGTIFQYIYVGDTGELDQQAGETMLREYPQVVKAIFLHVVSNDQYRNDNNLVTIPPPKLINGRPIIFFRTYVGAAIAAVQLGLMSLDGLESVMDAACDQLAPIPRTHSKWIDLNSDLDRAETLLLQII